ncbi:kinesin-like protein [Plakobranchus ocellatus]|uniref:Kinesin-like protein n=1 Tax=Plakobranchus ocellatus TaxID=259542 RepID=A0AAV4A9H7_9GAST|nr:kinesin-like protein [Plakobranchus ocellatus]
MERKPLATRSNLTSTASRLPVSGSRLKRARSPAANESANVGKKQCVEKETPVGLTRHVSSSHLSNGSTTRPKLHSTKSSSNLMSKKPVGRPAVSHTTAASRGIRADTRPGAATAPRPVTGRPPANAASALNSTVVSTGVAKPKKRPAWDLKGRLQDMETHMQTQTKNNSNLQGQVTECNFRIAHLESLNQKLSGDVEEKHLASQSAVKEIEQLREKLRATTKYEFSFDKVFQPESTQAQVFEEISQLVQSALDGYNVCIFAYGQTGSGKTYTMEGCLEDEASLGMIPRTVQQIFTAVRDLEGKGWSYTFVASMLEIYNESIYDLLCKGSAREEKLDIKLLGKGEDVHVPKLTTVGVKSEQQVLNLLRKATESRSVAETKCNQRSSRSHSVFQLRLEGANSITGESSKGLLNLVDLAGSERVKDSGSEGQRLVEAQSINKSLSNLGNVIMSLGNKVSISLTTIILGNVIMSLGNKEKHIPYRNSKLTYLLQNSLGGNSKTLMFVNVSPKEECFCETLNSLRFATKVNQCNIGTAQKKS